MKLAVTGWPSPIYVYGNPEVRAAVCRDLQRLELAYIEVGSSPQEVAGLTLEEGAPLVIALGPEDIFGKIRGELAAQNESLRPHIWRDIEFFSELLTHAQVEDAPLCPEPERSVAVGMNIDFVLGGAETWATQLFFGLKEKLSPRGIPVAMWEARQDSPYQYVGREFYNIPEKDVVQFGKYQGFVDYTLAVLERLTRQAPALYFDNGSTQMLSAFFLAKKYLGLKTEIISVVHGYASIFFGRVTRCQGCIGPAHWGKRCHCGRTASAAPSPGAGHLRLSPVAPGPARIPGKKSLAPPWASPTPPGWRLGTSAVCGCWT